MRLTLTKPHVTQPKRYSLILTHFYESTSTKTETYTTPAELNSQRHYMYQSNATLLTPYVRYLRLSAAIGPYHQPGVQTYFLHNALNLLLLIKHTS
jgi:hypothetical protein